LRLKTSSQVLDKRIDDFSSIILDYYQLNDNLGDPGIPSQDDLICVGRICPETDGAKLSETSTWLESSRFMGAGVRVMLRFDEKCAVRGGAAEGGIGLFPGMIVGVKGRNAGGGYFSVNEIFQVRTTGLPFFCMPPLM
jgi:DNA polymerase alpha subunit B